MNYQFKLTSILCVKDQIVKNQLGQSQERFFKVEKISSLIFVIFLKTFQRKIFYITAPSVVLLSYYRYI